MSGLLAGVRVLDVSNFVSGPLCGYMLAQLGAEVIKIEEPQAGDPSRRLGSDPALSVDMMGSAYLATNSGKRSVALNLKSGEGADIFKRLVRQSTVVLENFRPGVMARLGLGYEQLRSVNPKLVYCAISGFGQNGPLCEYPAFDQIIQGMSGLMSVTGTQDTGPLRTGVPISDTIAGLTAAMAIAAAVHRLHREGIGSMVDVAMLDSLIGAMGWTVSNYLIAGAVPRPMGNDNFTSSPSGTFAAADGMLNIAINTEQQYQRLLKALNRPELALDPRFATRESRKQYRHAMNAAVEESLRHRTVSDWTEVMAREGVPSGAVLSVQEALSLPQLEHRKLVQRFESALPGPRDLQVLRAGFHVDGEAVGVSSPPVVLGADTLDVLMAAGLSAEEIHELGKRGVIVTAMNGKNASDNDVKPKSA